MELATVAITVQVVIAEVIGLPDFDGGIGHEVAARIEYLSREGERHARIAGRAQHIVDGRKPLVHRAKRVRRGGLADLLFAVLKSREHPFGRSLGCN